MFDRTGWLLNLYTFPLRDEFAEIVSISDG